MGAFRWSPDGNWLAVQFPPAGSAADRRRPGKERQQQGLSDPPWVIDDLFYRLDGEGYFGGNRHRLYLVDLRGDGRPARELYGQDTLGMFTLRLLARLAATGRDHQSPPGAHAPSLQGRIAADRRGQRQDHGGSRACRRAQTAVCWSPDGQTIAYAGRLGNDPLYSTENLELFVCHPSAAAPAASPAEHDLLPARRKG